MEAWECPWCGIVFPPDERIRAHHLLPAYGDPMPTGTYDCGEWHQSGPGRAFLRMEDGTFRTVER